MDFAAQLDAIRKIENEEKLVEGTPAYIINNKWFELWKRSVGYNKTIPPTNENLEPLDNSSLLDKNGRLKTSCYEGTHYTIVTKSIWQKLVEWYDAKPVIEVPVVYDAQNKRVVAVSRLFCLKIKFNEKTAEVYTSKYETPLQVKKEALKILELPDDYECRIVIQRNTLAPKVLDEQKKLYEQQVTFSTNAVLDHKIDGKWTIDENAKPETTIHKGNEESKSLPATRNTSRLNSTRPGLTGLSNLGNTCFFNSGVQCLTHTEPLRKLFATDDFKKDLNRTNKIGCKGRMAEAFCSVCRNIWSGSYSSFSPSELKGVVGRFATQFSGYSQQDSHELVTFMLDGLHEDLNRILQKPIVDSVYGDGTDDSAKSEEAWKAFKSRNDSAIVDIFYGQLRSKLSCPNCGKVTTVFDPYNSIPLPLVQSQRRRVKYIPYDFDAKPISGIVDFGGHSGYASDYEAVKEQMKLTSHFVLVTRPTSGGGRIGSDRDNLSGQLFAMEMPNPDKFYVPISLRVYKPSLKEICPVFLVEVDSPQATEEEVDAAIVKKMSKVFEEDDTPLPPAVAKVVESFSKPTKPFAEGQLVRSSFGMYFSYMKEKPSLKPSIYEKLCNGTTITADLNTEAKISYLRLFRHAGTVEAVDSSMTLSACFDLFEAPETLDEKNQWHCPHCKQFVCATKELQLWSLPQVLIVQLKRFVGSGAFSKKLGVDVSFPDEIDMAKYVAGPHQEKMMYRLYAVSNHMGGLGGGHYTANAIVRDPEGKKEPIWGDFNDSSASETNSSSAHSAAAYMLFYERIEA